MKTNIVDRGETKVVSAENGKKTRLKWPALVLALISAALGAAGCEGTYSAYPGYGPYYGGPNYGGPYYGGGYPASVTVAVGDRPYYRGPGYWSGRVYYVWVPGHWSRHGHVWIRGHYVVRGY
jgi:hypothetical protein